MIQIIQQTLFNLLPKLGQGINHDPRHPGQSVVVPGSVQRNINTSRAEFRSDKRGQFLLNQEEHVNKMWGFYSIGTLRVWIWRSVFFIEYISAIHHWLTARLAKIDDVTCRTIFRRLPCFSDLLNPCNYNAQMMKKMVFLSTKFMFSKSNKCNCQLNKNFMCSTPQ